MMVPYYFMFFGLALVFLEFFMPGLVLGALGIISILYSYILIATGEAGRAEILFFVGGSIVALALLVRFAIWSIPRASQANSIYSGGSQTGYVASSYDHTAIGKTGIVLTDLKPGGYITIEGQSHPALSVSGYLEKETEVTVLSGDGENLIVKQKED